MIIAVAGSESKRSVSQKVKRVKTVPLSPAAMLGRLFSVVSIVRCHSKIKKHIKYSAQYKTSLPI